MNVKNLPPHEPHVFVPSSGRVRKIFAPFRNPPSPTKYPQDYGPNPYCAVCRRVRVDAIHLIEPVQ